jgi:hypothetical protein
MRSDVGDDDAGGLFGSIWALAATAATGYVLRAKGHDATLDKAPDELPRVLKARRNLPPKHRNRL